MQPGEPHGELANAIKVFAETNNHPASGADNLCANLDEQIAKAFPMNVQLRLDDIQEPTFQIPRQHRNQKISVVAVKVRLLMKLTKDFLLCNMLCAASAMGQVGKASDYYPLQIGNIWEYDATYQQWREEIVSDTTAPDGIRYYKILLTSPDEPSFHAFSYYHYSVDSTKVYQVGAQIGTDEWLFMDTSKDVDEPWFAHADSSSRLAISDTGQAELFGKNWARITIQPVAYIEGDSVIYIPDAYLGYAKGLGEIASGGGTWLAYARISGVEYGTRLAVGPKNGSGTVPREVHLRVHPNPFGQYTILQVKTNQRETAQITIHNVLGQAVRVLFNGHLTIGRFDFQWDGKDEAGRDLAQGFYFVRIQTSRSVVSQTMTLIR